MKNITQNLLLFNFTLLLSIALTPEVNGQIISGYVLDNETSLPIDGAVVMLISESETFYFEVKSDGYFLFEVYQGDYQLACSHRGYVSRHFGDISVGYDEMKSITLKLNPVGYVEPGAQDETAPETEQETIIPLQEDTATDLAEARQDKSAAGLITGPKLAIGAGYAFGRISGIEGSMDISLSRLFGGKTASSPFFIQLAAGGQTSAYKSDLFNEPGTEYDFGFTRLSIGIYKLFRTGTLLITPGFSGGMEQAKPKSDNVHALIDDDLMRVFYFNPTLALGYPITRSLVVQVSGTYYMMMNDVWNRENKIFAYKKTGEDTMTPWSYTDDFFSGRKGFSLLAGIKIYF
jgi:hypothetical protein